MVWGGEGVLNTVLVAKAHDPRAGQLSRYSVRPKSTRHYVLTRVQFPNAARELSIRKKKDLRAS